ncbi:MAG: hypothetical protein II145_06940 [Selenomonas sp.]|nr:hypothetical protein [Selenomonas sp.]
MSGIISDPKDFNGLFTEYGRGPIPYDLHALDAYCRAHALAPNELAPEVLAQFRIKPANATHRNTVEKHWTATSEASPHAESVHAKGVTA